MIWMKARIEMLSRLVWATVVVFAGAVYYCAVAPAIATKNPASLRPEQAGLIFPLQVDTGAGSSGYVATITWLVYLQIALVMAPFAALLLSGSGVNSQTTYGVRQGAHPSMIFTLSLPVARWKWLVVRNALGMAGFSVILLVLLAIPPIFSRFTGGYVPFVNALSVFPFAWLGCAVFYALSMALGSYFDELGQGVLAMAGVGFMVGIAVANVRWLNIFEFMSAQSFLHGGPFPWVGTAVCAGITIALTGVSVWILERREF